MRDFIHGLVTEAAKKIGIDTVILRTAPNLTLPKPRVEIEFMPDSYIPTGRKIAKRREDGKEVIVHERYQIDTPVMLYIIDNDDSRIQWCSRELVLAFPRGVADSYNNWVKIRASQAEWTGFKAPTLGLDAKRIEPMKERTFSVRVGFMWRLTYEESLPYVTNIQFTVSPSFRL